MQSAIQREKEPTPSAATGAVATPYSLNFRNIKSRKNPPNLPASLAKTTPRSFSDARPRSRLSSQVDSNFLQQPCLLVTWRTGRGYLSQRVVCGEARLVVADCNVRMVALLRWSMWWRLNMYVLQRSAPQFWRNSLRLDVKYLVGRLSIREDVVCCLGWARPPQDAVEAKRVGGGGRQTRRERENSTKLEWWWNEDNCQMVGVLIG